MSSRLTSATPRSAINSAAMSTMRSRVARPLAVRAISVIAQLHRRSPLSGLFRPMREGRSAAGERPDDGQVLPSLGLIVLVASAPSTAWLAVVIGVAESILLHTGLDSPEMTCSDV